MNVRETVAKMTTEEKIHLLTGGGGMDTAAVERLDIEKKHMADGPVGIRNEAGEGNCTSFPNISALAASWNPELCRLYGNVLADDCIEHDIDMILGPGVNIKKNILCGRNFEYFSEDPYLAGELAGEYIKGVEENGVAACIKHFAANNQERYRTDISAEVDERTLREIYLKPFEIAVKKAKPTAVMCAYNKLNSIWCSENKMLITDILKKEWGYQGIMVSDWCAVHDSCKAIAAGLDLEMPPMPGFDKRVKNGLETGKLELERVNDAAERVTEFALRPRPKKKEYDREKQHSAVCKIAAEGCVLLKNENHALPLNQYKKIAVVGEFAKNPILGGQGSAEVYPEKGMIDCPLEELRKALPDTEILFKEYFKKKDFSAEMLWPQLGEYQSFVSGVDAVVVFAGNMVSEDTEKFDRRTAELNPNYEMFIEEAAKMNKPTIVVLQTGSAVITGEWNKRASAVVEMWLGGEGGGKAIAEILAGKINPSGKLPETFPNRLRNDFDYPGDGLKVKYNEGLAVGYRYYDKHPEEIGYPFGHGLSYTEFEYTDAQVNLKDDSIHITVQVENTGNYDGAETVQVYVGASQVTYTRPIKELKGFRKKWIRKGEKEKFELVIPVSELGYYNIMLHEWVTEPGIYDILIGSSSRDIQFKKSIEYKSEPPYSMENTGSDMIGGNDE